MRGGFWFVKWEGEGSVMMDNNFLIGLGLLRSGGGVVEIVGGGEIWCLCSVSGFCSFI